MCGSRIIYQFANLVILLVFLFLTSNCINRGSNHRHIKTCFIRPCDKISPRETLRFSRNKIYCFPRDQSLSDLLHSWKFIKPYCNGGHRSTFAGDIALLPSDVMNFLQCFPLKAFGGKQFHCQMSCDLEVTNETARC